MARAYKSAAGGYWLFTITKRVYIIDDKVTDSIMGEAAVAKIATKVTDSVELAGVIAKAGEARGETRFEHAVFQYEEEMRRRQLEMMRERQIASANRYTVGSFIVYDEATPARTRERYFAPPVTVTVQNV